MKKKNYIKGLVILLVFISAILWKQLLPGKAEQGSLTVEQFVNKVGTDNVEVVDNNIQNVSINSSEDLIYLSNVNAEYYQNATIEIIATNELDLSTPVEVDGLNYQGLGSESYPFAGVFTTNVGIGINLKLNNALFQAVDGSVKQPSIGTGNSQLITYTGTGTGIIAEQVIFRENLPTEFNWNIPINIGGHPSGIISKIVNNSNSEQTVKLGVDLDPDSVSPITFQGSDSTGFICGELGANIILDISQVEIPNDITIIVTTPTTDATTTTGSAGALIGKMGEASKLITKDEMEFTKLTISGPGSVGGLIGEANSPSIVKYSDKAEIPNIKIESVLVQNGTSCGGVFGTLNNNIDMAMDEHYYIGNITYGSQNEKMILGGLIGTYSAIESKVDFIISNINDGKELICEQNKNTLYYGGLIGQVVKNSYVKVNEVTVTANHTPQPSNKGGLIGYVGDGSVIDVGTVSVAGSYQVEDGGYYGGIVGIVENDAIVKLSGTTTLEGQEQINKNYGRIVGNLMWALVYADAGWKIVETGAVSQIDNIGTNGDVIRNDKIEDIIQFNQSENTVTIKNGFSEKITANQIISSKADFARLAIALQTQSANAGALNFNITLTGDITLTETGIYGLTRSDAGNQMQTYTGTVDGGGHKITLDIGGNIEGDTEVGRGVYTKEYLGLFGVITGDTTVNNLTVDGNINIKQNSTSVNFGALAGLVDGQMGDTLQLSNLTISPKIGFCISDINTKKNLLYGGGAIGEIHTMNVKIGEVDLQSSTVKLKDASIKNTDMTNTSDPTGNSIYQIGGLTGNITGENETPDGRVNIQIEYLDIENTSITMSDTTISTFGGLLGNIWTHVDISVNKSLVVTGSTIDISHNNGNKSFFGGLLHTVDGSFIQQDGAQVSISNTKFLHSTKNSNHNGLLIGDASDTYISIDKEFYKLDKDTITVTTDNSYFDEIAGCNLKDLGTKDNGIISIRTGLNHEKFYNDGTFYIYQDQLGELYKSKDVRYYYNLETILKGQGVTENKSDERVEITDGTVDTIYKLMLWSVRNLSNIACTYWGGLESDTYNITGEIDTTGYSYYAVTPQTDLSITDAIITFDNKSVNQSQTVNTPGFKDDNCNTACVYGNHYRMHGGILYSQKTSLNVSNLRLKGSISSANDIKATGALICNSITGSLQQKTKVSISGVILDGIEIYNYANLPMYALLIHQILNYVNIDISGVTYEGYNSDKKAAAGLICNIGNKNAVGINISFSDMALDGRSAESIFAHANFAHSFAYKSDSTGVYNFTYDEAWQKDENEEYHPFRHVTYGKEITESLRNPGEQLKYYDTEDYVSTNIDDIHNSKSENFNTDNYLPYIKLPQSNTQKEFDINLKKADLVEGKGTYEKPYVITNPRQLYLVSQYFISEVPMDEWIIFVEKDIDEATTSETHCQWRNGKWIKGKYSKSENFISNSPEETISEQKIREYLLNAYYQIDSNITMSPSFEGLGTITNPFQGVIIGKDAVNHVTVKYPIDPSTHTEFGGLIKVSNGAVVKDLTIQLGNKLVLKSNQQAVGNLAFFGGVIGTILGGDNVIDNVVIEQQSGSVITIEEINSKYEKYASVGGYVGLLKGGGVIFKNLANNDKFYEKFLNDSYLYTNPYVGRVLDGFAIDVNDAIYNDNILNNNANILNNGDDYSIPILPERKEFLEVALSEDKRIGDVTVIDEEGLYILSAIVNSGAGSNSKNDNKTTYASSAYNSGKVRNGHYNNIGESSWESDIEAVIDDKIANDENKIPYLIKYYTNETDSFYGASKLANMNTRWNMHFRKSSYDMESFKNGFRGIGARYQTNTSYEFKNRILHVGNINKGNQDKVTIRYDMKVNQYTYTLSEEKDDCFLVRSMGLFNYFMQDGMNHDETEKVVENLEIYGKNHFSKNNVLNDEVAITNNFTSQGMLIGSMYSDLKEQLKLYQSHLSNIHVYDIEMSGATYTGGIIGNVNTYSNSNKSIYNITIDNCKVNQYNIQSWGSAGAILGNASYAKISLIKTYTSNQENASRDCIQGKVVGGMIGSITTDQDVTLQECGVGLSCSNNSNTQSVLLTGLNNQTGIVLGGIIGKVIKDNNHNFILKDSIVNNVVISSLCNNDKIDSCVGGIYGTIVGESYVMEGIKLIDNLLIGKEKAGGVVGEINANSRVYIHDVQWVNNVIGNDLRTPLITEDGQRPNDSNISMSANNVFLGQSNDKKSYDEMSKDNPQFDNVGIWVGTIDPDAKPLYITDATLGYRTETMSGEKQVALIPMRSIGNKEDRNKNPQNSIAAETAKEFEGYIQYNLTENPLKKLEEFYKYQSNDEYLRNYNFSHNYFYHEGTEGKVPEEVQEQFTTFNKFHGLDVSDGDYPVLVIESNKPKEVTAMLKGYLDLVLENGFSEVYYSSGSKRRNAPDNIDINSYKLVEDSTSLWQQEEVASLAYDASRSDYFYVVPGQWDNDYKRVTVIELTYNIKTINKDGGVVENTHVVRIPVVVKQIVHVDFSATIQEGTNFSKDTYQNMSQVTLSNYGDKYTTLLEYHYTDYDWIGYLESGGSLLWNYEKKIKWGGTLPQGSQLTLIDLNNQNKMYTYMVPEGGATSVELKEFKKSLSEQSENNESMKTISLNDLLNLNVQEDENGKWVESDNQSGTVHSGGKWYCLALEDSSTTELSKRYSIGLSEQDFVPIEQYYLTVKTPKLEQAPETGLTIDYDSTFVANNQNTIKMLPFEIEEKSKAESTGVIYQAISQTFTTDGQVSKTLLDSKGDKVTLEYTNHISCSTGYYEFIKDKGERFVELSLAPVLKTLTSENNVAFTAPIDATVEFEVTNKYGHSISQKYNVTYSQPLNEIRFILGDGTTAYNIVESLRNLGNGSYGCTVKTAITLNIPEVAMDMFPYSKSDDESGSISEYIRFNAQSKIAVQEESFKSTEGTKCEGIDKYYRNLSDMASLHYNVNDRETDLGVNSLNLEQPGEPQHISTLAVYNTELISKATWDKVTEIECELTLYNKSDEQGEANKMIPYTKVDVDGNSEWIDEYLTIKLQDSQGTEKELPTSKFTLDRTDTNNFEGYYHPDSQQLVLPLELYVTPNLSNINDKYKYSNYMVALHVTLWGANKQIIVPEKTDYIRYTHANIPKRIIRTLEEIN